MPVIKSMELSNYTPITPDLIDALRPGDRIEMVLTEFNDFHVVGLVEGRNCDCLVIGPFALRDHNNPDWIPDGRIRVIEHAPRPFYVNHHRMEPHPGDVARGVSLDGVVGPWQYDGETWWSYGLTKINLKFPNKLRLLYDGEKNEVVPPEDLQKELEDWRNGRHTHES